MIYLKADTAVEVLIGPVVAVGDGFTPVTTMSIASADEAEIIKYNGNTALAVTAITGTVAAITNADGYYTLDLSASDVDTEGFLVILINDDSLMLPIRHEFMVVNANVYDSLFAASGTDTLQADLTEIGGVAQSATDLKDFADAGYDPATNKVQGVVLVDTTTTNTDMRGTDNAALASVLGALADAAADGDPTSVDTVVQYLKQIINTLEGTAGIVTYPAEAAPGNAVSLAEIIRAIHTDVTGLNGDVMRGTDSAALASVCTEGRLSELDAGNLPTDIAGVQSDTDDIQSRLPAALIGGRMDSDVEAINNDTTSASNLRQSTLQVITGAAEGTPSTTVIQTNLAETQDDIYIGRTVIFTSGAAKDEATDITDYTGSTGTLTVSALANAPSAADTFIII